jgi:[amino group carrier protein]-lysine/ornithine hydrolase
MAELPDDAERTRPATWAADQSAAIELLRKMLEIPSPSYAEAELASFLAAELPSLGFSTEVDAAGNLVAELVRGDGPTVLLLGHLDTVAGQLPVRQQDGRLYGRGAVDAKGPLATMICAAAAAERFAGRLLVIGAVEEETALSRGAMHVRANQPAPAALIIGEPSGWQSVVLGYKGKLDVDYRVECPPTHPSNPVPKATELAAGCWQQVLELLGPDAGHDRFDQPGPTLVSIAGDLCTATAEISIRTPPGFDPDGFLAALAGRLPAGELVPVNSVAACRVGRNDPVVRALTAAIRRRDARPVAKVKTATSDMNTLAEAWQVPMATYGPGDSTLDHSAEEHLVIAEYLAAIEVLGSALVTLGTELSDTGSTNPAGTGSAGAGSTSSADVRLGARPMATAIGGLR